MTKVDRLGPMLKRKTPSRRRQTPILQKGTKESGCCFDFRQKRLVLGSLINLGYDRSDRDDYNEINFNNWLFKWYWP